MNARFLIALLLIPALFSGCGTGARRAAVRREKQLRAAARLVEADVAAVRTARAAALDAFVAGMPLEEKVGQLFIVNLEGNAAFFPVERTGALFGFPREGKALVPGGYVFFHFNLAESPQKIMEFTDSIRTYCLENGIVPPFLAVDQEGGFVSRLRTVAGPLPSASRVAERLSVAEAYRLYSLQAVQMKALGFDMNLAPVVEVCTAENADFLDGRSFGPLESVLAFSRAAVNAFENAGVGAVCKHFPGNSNTAPHSGLPEISVDAERLDSYLLPFRRIVSARPAGILMSHARVSSRDAGVPACLSGQWISGTLRGEFGYDGIIFSDDVFMSALAENGYPPESAAVKAVSAGADCIMISEKRFAAPASVLLEAAAQDAVFAARLDDAARRVVAWKIRHGILEYAASDSQSGWDAPALEVVPSRRRSPVEERLSAFDAARRGNIDLYIDCFQ